MQSTVPKTKTQISFLIREEAEVRHRSFVNSLQYDATAGQLYSGGSDSVIRRWDVPGPSRVSHPGAPGGGNSPRYVLSMDHHCDWVNDIVLCSEGSRLLSASSDTTIKVWNTRTGSCLSTLRTHTDSVRCLAYAPEASDIFVSAGLDKCIYLWDLASLTKVTPLNNTVKTASLHGTKNSVYSVAINALGTVVLGGSPENILRVWDARTCEKIAKLRGHSDNIRAIAVNRDGTMVFLCLRPLQNCLSGSSDGTVRLWSIGQRRCIGSIRCHSDSVWSLQADANFAHVVSGGRDQRVFTTPLRNLSQNELLFVEDQPVQKILMVDSDGGGGGPYTHVWAATWSSSIRRWPMKRSLASVAASVNGTMNGVASSRNGPISISNGNEPTDSPACSPSTNRTFAMNGGLETSKDSPRSATTSHRYRTVSQCQTPRIDAPDLLIQGAPSIRKYVVLNDKRHIVTRDTENNVQMWDVLQGRRVKDFGKVNLEDVVRENFRRIFVPSWFSVDAKCGVLEITLDEADVFSAWVSAKDANFPDKPGDAKINYGGMMLKSLFEQWPLSYNDSEDESPLHGFFTIPLHTPILIRNYCEDLARPAFRCTARDTANQQDSVMLRDHLPTWVVEVVQHNQFPKFNKIPFVLQPHPTFPTKIIKKDRLSATEMLQVRKVMEHVFEKILYPNTNELSNGDGAAESNNNNYGTGGYGGSAGGTNVSSPSSPPPQSIMPQPLPTNIEERVELFCNEQKLDPEMDLRTVKHFIWKQGGDLLLHYRPVR